MEFNIRKEIELDKTDVNAIKILSERLARFIERASEAALIPDEIIREPFKHGFQLIDPESNFKPNNIGFLFIQTKEIRFNCMILIDGQIMILPMTDKVQNTEIIDFVKDIENDISIELAQIKYKTRIFMCFPNEITFGEFKFLKMVYNEIQTLFQFVEEGADVRTV